MKGVCCCLLVTFIVTLLSCAYDFEIVHRYIDPETEPDIIAENVRTSYSDSARLQMRMETPLMKQFTSATEQRQEFPHGFHVRFFESNGDQRAEITANWARRDLSTNIWEARDNVVVVSAKGEVLETEQLFWDANQGIIYSEKFTKIKTEDGTVATGDTFSGKQDFSEYGLFRGRATIFLRDEE